MVDRTGCRLLDAGNLFHMRLVSHNVEQTIQAALLVLALGSLGIFAPAPFWLRALAGLLVTAFVPGVLLTALLLKHRSLTWAERAVVSVGLGYSCLLLVLLALQTVPGPLQRRWVLITFWALNLALLALNWRFQIRGMPQEQRERETGSRGFSTARPRLLAYAPGAFELLRSHLPLLVVLLVAAFLRLTNLGYSEFQGDEARAMLLAAGVIQGHDEALLLHKKGPAEVLLPVTSYVLLGRIDELSARLPFALASLAGVLGVYALTCRLYPRHVHAAVVAAGLLAVDGYLVAFARIVQYQSVVFLMMVLAAWCFYLWYRDSDPVLAVLAAVFVAMGTLAHYEAILVLPFMAWLFWARAWREGWPLHRWVRQALGPVVAFAIVASAFYVPFVLHPHFTETAQYITERRIGGELLYNNLGRFFHLATFYNSTYYIVFLILGLLALVMHQLRTALRPAPLATSIQLAFAAALMGVVLFPQALIVRGLNLAFLPFAAILATLGVLQRVGTELKATFLWFGVPFLIASFLTLKPNTHFYTMFPAWAMLVGVAVSHLVATLSQRIGETCRMARIRVATLTVGSIVLLAVFGYYIYIVFVQHTPDYRRGYPATRPPFYPVVYGDQVPKGGVFGFPHRGGWKAIGALYAQGALQGSYSANEEPLINSWYVRRAAWCRDAADYYFITSVIHDIENIPVDRIRTENYLLGRVWSDGRSILEIYSRQPVAAPIDYDLTELQHVFDASTQPDLSLWALETPMPQYRVDARLGERARLVGFDAPPQVVAGGALPLVLYWEPLAPFDQHYNVFAHVEVEGERIWGQSDGSPACGRQPTTEWQPGQMVVDSHSLPLDPGTPPGEYPVLVGLYDAMSGERLPVVGRDINPYGNAVYLGTVMVVAPTSIEATQGLSRNSFPSWLGQRLARAGNNPLTSPQGDGS